MEMLPELPTDIWLQIIPRIPDYDLDRLLSVNSLFFGIVMKKRYGEVRLSNALKERKKSLCYIRRLADPFVGKVVRSLSLRLEFMPTPARPSSPGPSWKGRIQNTVNKVMKRHPPAPSASSLSETQWFDEVMVVFPRLVNLQMFAVHLYCTPASVDCASFFEPAWKTFGAHLPSLSIGGDIDSVRRVVVTKPHFPALQHLSMEYVRHPQEETAEQGLYLAQDIIPFLNDLAPHLQCFRLWCWAKFELSTFLKRLGPFPSLKSVSVRGHFDNAFQNDGSGIPVFLSQMPALKDLELRLNPQRVGLDPSTEQPLAQWLMDCTSDPRLFKDLRSLQIYPTNRPDGIDITLNSIIRSSHSLTAITIRDRYLDLEEATRVVTALKDCNQLLYLRMNIRTLTIEIFDMLSSYLPHLRQLSLYLTDGFGASDNMTAFLGALQDRHYVTWNLTDIGLWQGGYDEVELDSMSTIAQCIPSVKSFWGNEEEPMLPDALCANPFP